MAVTFTRVQEILSEALAAWTQRKGREPRLYKHDNGFGWSTPEQLLGSTAFGLPLIDSSHIVNKTGDQTNLVVALRAGVPPYPRMPIGGPFMEEAEVSEIIEWINAGAT